MQKSISTVQDLGVLVRAARKSADIRIDDMAATVGLSKQFVNDLELGKEGVQLGKVLKVLAELGVHVYVDMTDSSIAYLDRSIKTIQQTNSRRSRRKDTENGK